MDTETRIKSEDQAEKQKIDVLEVVIKLCTGTVKWYSHKLLYGFISRKDNQEDVFVHRSAISASNSRTPNLRNGEDVEFSVVRTTNGIEAYNVTGPEGTPVQGFTLMRRRRRNRPSENGGEGDAEAVADNGPEDGADQKAGRPRRRPPRRGRGGAHTNGETNGTHAEGDVYYPANQNDDGSPMAGQSRPVKRDPEGGFGRRGGGRGVSAVAGAKGGGFRGARGGGRGTSGVRRGGMRGGSRGGPDPSNA